LNHSIKKGRSEKMPRTEAANQRRRLAQREKILDAARKVFARKGMEATMGEIAAEASLSHGLAYHYFANKEALFHALVEQTIQTDPAGLRRVSEASGTPGERLALLLAKLVTSRRENPEFYQILDQVHRSETTPDDLRELMDRQGQLFFAVMRQLIAEGQATGEVAPGDPDQLVSAVAAYLEGLTRLALLYPGQFQQHYPDAEFLLRILKPLANP
jgi:AcrR family transcriptional regulator